MEQKIRDEFNELISHRKWYGGTSINRTQASEIKRRFKRSELGVGRILEILMECGYTVSVSR